jgi:hypothetical protein
MTDQKMRAIADSAWLRVVVYLLNFVIVSVVIPVAFGAASKMLDRLDSIEKSTAAIERNGATVEVRLLRAEQEVAALRDKVEYTGDKALVLETQLTALRERILTVR